LTFEKKSSFQPRLVRGLGSEHTLLLVGKIVKNNTLTCSEAEPEILRLLHKLRNEETKLDRNW